MNEIAKRAILPPILKANDVIGLAPLAGPHQEEDFQKGAAILRDFGFNIKTLRPTAPLPFLAGSDQERLDIFLNLWQDPEVKAVMAIRGGYGTLRLLANLDYDLFKENPKPLIGFSDISGLLNVITERSGLLTFHGPNLTTLEKSDKKSLESLIDVLTRPQPNALKPENLEVIRGGQVEGILAGGNLTTLIHLIGTSFQPHLQDKILFLEDVGEAPYRIDRLLTQLHLTGVFSNIKGVILGEFNSCGDQEEIWQRVTELVEDNTIPIWAGFPVGHGQENLCLPIGSQVVMDSNRGTLTWSAPCHGV
ncbi:MAG: LD-carboxypeptidase [Thermodesulfobacteriota bacterium]